MIKQIAAAATRTTIAVIPLAMVSAYASGILVTPPRLAQLQYSPVAEIVVSPSTVGVAESPLYGETDAQIGQQLDALQAIGVQNIRVFVPWALIQQSPTSYDWTELDRVMNAAAARNMGVMAEINSTPSFAAPNPNSPGLPLGSATPNVAAFTTFVKAFMARTDPAGVNYASTVSAYEIWNEPNYVQFSNPIDPVAYAQLLKAVYPVIKAADPTATVVAGAVGATQNSVFTMDPVTFVKDMLAAGAAGSFDALSFHPYDSTLMFSGTCPTCAPGILTPQQQVQAIMALIPNQKVWITEYGESTQPGGALYQTEATYIKNLLDTWQSYSQAGPIFLYTGQDTATGSTDPNANMGIWTDTGGQKTYTVNGATYSVSQMLAAWIAAHPQSTVPTKPVPPVPPVPPVNPFAALLAQLQAQLQARLNAISYALTHLFGAPATAAATPTATAQTVALRVASGTTPQAPAQAQAIKTSAEPVAKTIPAAAETTGTTGATETTSGSTTSAASEGQSKSGKHADHQDGPRHAKNADSDAKPEGAKPETSKAGTPRRHSSVQTSHRS
jgi:hypothetical protein